jgi:hypothetical protein
MKIILRIILDVMIFIAVLQGWWPAAVVLALVVVWLFSFPIEIILVGVAYDALFGMVHGMGIKGYSGTIGSVILLIFVMVLKKMMR